MVAQQHSIRSAWLTETWLHAGRLLTRWRRDRGVLVGSLSIPVCLLLAYYVVLDERVHKVTGVESVYGLVPLCAVLSALFGAFNTAIGIQMERESGLFTRLWVLPLHRISTLTGRMAAEAVRALVGTVLITGIGVALGLRFTHGWATALAYILIPSIVVIGFTALVMALAIRTNGRSIMSWLVAATVSLAFINPGTTPIDQFPGWLRLFARMQPMSPPIEVMYALAHNGPLLWPAAMTFFWTVALLAMFTPMAMRGYRSAAESPA